LLFGVCITAEVLVPSLIAFALLWFPLGMFATAFTTLDQTILQRTAAPEYQGRVMSMFSIAWMGTTPIGGLIVGALIDTISARAALAFGAIAALLCGAYALLVTARKPDPEQQLLVVATEP
jgi:predicted MFS family arabinose efflux permease